MKIASEITMRLMLGLMMAALLLNLLIYFALAWEGISFAKDRLDQVVHPLELTSKYLCASTVPSSCTLIS